MTQDGTSTVPIPTRLVEPWVEDNALFLQEVADRNQLLQNAPQLREHFSICRMREGSRSRLAAVDAGVLDVTIGDLMSILIQAVRVDDDGTTFFPPPRRITGINAQELSLARTPIRVAAECTLLAASEDITIADTSFWSMLMEVNQVITRYVNGGAQQQGIADAFTTLIRESVFLEMLNNPHVIAMSKTNQGGRLSRKVIGGAHKALYASDREMFGRILEAGEFITPYRLIDASEGQFGVEGGSENRGFTAAEKQEIRQIYEEGLGLLYFKPHQWSRAFRIEASWGCLMNEDWLMGLLNGITYHTTARTVEPWPQLMADYSAKAVSGVAILYGEQNFFRTPYFDPSRTLVAS